MSAPDRAKASGGTARHTAGNLRPLRFALIFAACFLTAIGLLKTPPAQAVDVRFTSGLAWVSHAVVRCCGGHAELQGAVLRDPAGGFAVEMKDGCNAVTVTLLLWAAIVAFPAAWRLKAAGVLAGALIIQAVNIVRFISLYYIGQYNYRLFEFAHQYLWECLLILDVVVIFRLWVCWTERPGTARDAG